MIKDDFKVTDFVQVEHQKCLPYFTRKDKQRVLGSGEPVIFWRNALYVGAQDNHHIVIYTDGTKEVLRSNTKIRKAIKVKTND